LVKDTASTLVLVKLVDSGDEDITILTPAGTPRVLNDEGFQDTDLLVTDSQDSMIDLSTATSTDDTLAVELEDILISFNSNGNGTVN